MSVINALLPIAQKVVIEEEDASAGPSNGVELDCSKEEQHKASSDITDYPVEQGPNVTDSSRPKPRLLTLQFIHSSPPLTLSAATDNSGKFDSDTRRGETLFQQLLFWKDNATPLRVTTTLDTYTDMLISDIDVPRDAGKSDGIFCTLALKQIFTAQFATVAAPAVGQPKAAPKTATGTKPTAPVANVSVLDKIIGAVAGGSP